MKLFAINQPLWKPLDNYVQLLISKAVTDTEAIIDQINELEEQFPFREEEPTQIEIDLFAFITEELFDEVHDPSDDSWVDEIEESDIEELIERRVAQLISQL